MGTRSWKLIATNESTVFAKPLLDAIMVEDCQGNRCFPDSACADKSDGSEVFSEANDLLNQITASETRPGRRWWRFPESSRIEFELLDQIEIGVINLVWV
jgi:hypothetical protein